MLEPKATGSLPKTPLRALVVGLGRMGAFHARALGGRIPGIRLAAVADADLLRAETLAMELGVPAYPADEMLFRRVEADCVVIAAPSPYHGEWIERAAGAGLPVFCEKPLGKTVAEARAALRVADEARIPLQIGFQRRFDRGLEVMRERAVQGVLGRVVMVKSTIRDPEISPIEYLRDSGGIFQDQMIHDIDALRFLANDEIAEVYAAGDAYFEPALRDLGDVDTAVLVVRFAKGAIGIADATRACGYGHDIQAEIMGSDGTVRLDLAKEAPILDLGRGGVRFDMPHWFLERFAEAYERELAVFAEVARGQIASPVTGRDGLQDMLVAEAAGRSLRTGRSEPVEILPTEVTV